MSTSATVGTVVFYNNVLLRDCELLEFAQTIEYDEETQTDPMFSRIRVTVASMVVGLNDLQTGDLFLSGASNQHPSVSFPVGVSIDGTVPDTLAAIQQRLQQPRKDFWMATNANTPKNPDSNLPNEHTPAVDNSQKDPFRIILAAGGIDDYAEVDGESGGRVVPPEKLNGTTATKIEIFRDDVLDANNGPRPISCSVVRIDGGRAMRVHFSIEICRALCQYEPGQNDPSAHPVRDAEKVVGVISNKWNVTEDIDANWQVTLNVEGTLRVRDQRFKPDAMRLMTAVALFPYGRMVSRQFFTSGSGLTLKYRYRITEAGVAPPPGLVDWSGTYSETTVTGGVNTGTVRVSVRGKNHFPIGRTREGHTLFMIGWLFKLLATRLRISKKFNPLPGVNPSTIIVQRCIITENMKEPEVSLECNVLHSGDDALLNYTLRLRNMGKELVFPGYDPRWWPNIPAFTYRDDSRDDNEYGSNYDCYYQNPCSDWHGKPTGWDRDFDIVPREGFNAVPYEGEDDPIDPVDSDVPQPIFADHGWSNEQLKSGFTYVKVEIDNTYDHHSGYMDLPLSTTRFSYNGSVTGAEETSVGIRVHAGIQRRAFVMHAVREGDWPYIPAPEQTITDSSTGVVEYLVEDKTIPETPRLADDGTTLLYSVQCRRIYSRTRPISYADDVYKVGSDPRDKTTPAQNAVTAYKIWDTDSRIV